MTTCGSCGDQHLSVCAQMQGMLKTRHAFLSIYGLMTFSFVSVFTAGGEVARGRRVISAEGHS